MIPEPPEYDPIIVWQNQMEHSAPSLEEISMRARAFEMKSRRRALVFWIAAILYLAVSITEDVAGIKGTIWWVGVIRFALFLVWVAYIPSRIGSIDNSSLTFLRITGITPVLDFYRTRLERQRDYFQDDNRRVFQLVAVSIGFILYSIFYPSLFLVFGIPIGVCATVLYRRRRGELPHIQRELEILDSLRKESQ